MPSPSDILAQASQLVSNDRREEYGAYEDEAVSLATGWSIITGKPVEPRHVPLMMVWLKVVREAHKHKLDNCVDGAGYFGLAGMVGASTVRTYEQTGDGPTNEELARQLEAREAELARECEQAQNMLRGQRKQQMHHIPNKL